MSSRPWSFPHPNPLPEGEGANVLREFHSSVKVFARRMVVWEDPGAPPCGLLALGIGTNTQMVVASGEVDAFVIFTAG